MLETTTYANYRRLCEALDSPIKGGKAKIAQLHQLESICKYHRNGRAYVIDEIYPHPMTIIKAPEKLEHKKHHRYSEYVAPLFFSLFNGEKEILVNNPYLFNQLGFCNENFGSYPFERDFIKEHPEFKESYYPARKMLYDCMSTNVQNALSKYKKDGLITKEPHILMIEKGDKQLTPTEDEIKVITKFKYSAYDSLEIKNFWDLRSNSVNSVSYEMGKKALCKENGWNNFYYLTRYTLDTDKVIIEPFSKNKKKEMISHINKGFYDRMIKHGDPKTLLDAIIKR